MRAMGWSEERLHRWIEGLLDAAGDDAVRVPRGRGTPVACVDHTAEAVHVEPGTAPARFARKAVARALSDLAASAATPRGLLCALAAPAGREEAWMRAVLRAVHRQGAAWGAPLLGGDLCACAPGTPGATLTITALGDVAAGRRMPARRRARPGQLLVLSGAVGGSGLGRHLAIEPRLEAGRALHAAGAAALMDVSDGLARDLARLARAAGVRIDLEHVPVHRDAHRAARADGTSAREHALHDGEDHELVAALPAAAARRLVGAGLPGAGAGGAVIIGRVAAGAGLWIHGQDDADGGAPVRWNGSGGFVHGG